MLLKRCDWLPRLNQKCFKTGESPLGLLRTNVRRNQFEQADHTKTAYLTIEILIFDLDLIYIKREIFSHNTSAILRENSLAIIYNGVSHRRSLKHKIFLIGRLPNMSVV